jgi:hypothetical protein
MLQCVTAIRSPGVEDTLRGSGRTKIDRVKAGGVVRVPELCEHSSDLR